MTLSLLSILFTSLTVFALDASDQNVNAQNAESLPVKPSVCFTPEMVRVRQLFDSLDSVPNKPFDQEPSVQQHIDHFQKIFNKIKTTNNNSHKVIDLLIERLDKIALENKTFHQKIELLHLKEIKLPHLKEIEKTYDNDLQNIKNLNE